ncbi:TIGR04283 family arsenosugar biosynthesis glycosyltransferase [Fuerstiella marisgermanici]|uniref:TIGR04283 family arsenosugar biosynthesis glycosyltransferase n=1 Tax=Fuerstiella marisgermanici TaxID=1891926 RepID=UPI001313FD30|nr:TIGR04283 family arsenosugar biosynthesis glycosyltransferase [Fuerstiella marisgermanici]
MPSVSVIIPTLNEEANVGRAIASAIEAGASEVIVVDAGSGDQTVAVASSAKATVLHSERGRAVQQNVGADAACGDVLLFLHADCELHEDAVSEICRRLSADPTMVGGCFRQRIDAGGMRYRIVEAGNALRVRLLKWGYGDQAIFVRKDVFQKLGGFPNLQLMEDLYFMKRLKRCGRIALLRSPLTVSARRWQDRGLVTQTLRNWTLITAAHLGISPDRLARFYPNDR